MRYRCEDNERTGMRFEDNENVVVVSSQVPPKAYIKNLPQGTLVMWEGYVYIVTNVGALRESDKPIAVNLSTGGYLTADTEVTVLAKGVQISLTNGDHRA